MRYRTEAAYTRTPSDLRDLAELIVHMRHLAREAQQAGVRGDIPTVMMLAMDHSSHCEQLHRRGMSRQRIMEWVERRVSTPALRQLERAYGVADATVTEMHPRDARDAAVRDVPAEVHQFPQRPHGGA